MRYAVIVEKGENSYGAYVPDLPGCVAVVLAVSCAKTPEETTTTPTSAKSPYVVCFFITILVYHATVAQGKDLFTTTLLCLLPPQLRSLVLSP
ncbi:MAG: hypothetical protein RLZZ69_553 [Cyanobacteriota bacterium]